MSNRFIIPLDEIAVNGEFADGFILVNDEDTEEDDAETPDNREAVNLSPPEYMRSAARRGLRLHEEGKSGDGLMPQTVEDARKMASGVVSEAKWRKIAPWIARHMVDLDAIQGDEITGGLVAHLLWGSNGTKAGAQKTMDYAQGVVDRLGDNRQYSSNRAIDKLIIEEGELPPSYRPSTSDDVPSNLPMCCTCEYFTARLDDNIALIPHCAKWDATVEPDGYCDAWDLDETLQEEEEEEGQEPMEIMPTAELNHWVVTQKEDRSIAYSNIEMRASSDGQTLVGYAAIFDSPSEPLPWTEFVRRGAFSKTINDKADVRLLIDHVGVPLARTKSGTLRLTEDEKGLRAEADLDPSNPDAMRIMSAVQRGDMSQMSFAFRTIKDSWSSDRATRELKEVQLYDVSIVTFPAYEQTVAELRNIGYNPVSVPSRLRRQQIAIAKLK